MEKQDISVMVGGHLLNVRTSALIVNSNKVLLHHGIGKDHYTLPGGRIKEGENSIEALQREIKEEMNIDTEYIRPVSVIENFFDLEGKKYHEILITHKLEFKNKELYNKEYYEPSEKHKKGKLEFIWKDITSIENINFVPVTLKKVLKENNKEFVHVINDER